MTKAESMRGDSFTASWIWRDDSHVARGMRPSPLYRNVGRSLTSRLEDAAGPVIFLPSTAGARGLRICSASLLERCPPRHDPATSAAPSGRAGFGHHWRQVAAEGLGEVRPQIPFARGGALANLLRLD